MSHVRPKFRADRAFGLGLFFRVGLRVFVHAIWLPTPSGVHSAKQHLLVVGLGTQL